MGRPEEAALDAQPRVYGVEGLRVADASVFPDHHKRIKRIGIRDRGTAVLDPCHPHYWSIVQLKRMPTQPNHYLRGQPRTTRPLASAGRQRRRAVPAAMSNNTRQSLELIRPGPDHRVGSGLRLAHSPRRRSASTHQPPFLRFRTRR